MSMSIGSVNNFNYQTSYANLKKLHTESSEIISESLNQDKTKTITPEEKIQMANQFWADHEAEHAKSQGEIMQRIGEGMAVAQEISRRMSSGAKVSQSDENNLMQYDMRMYMAAKNAQMMAQRKEDLSDESLIDEYVEKHKNDQKDFVSEELDKIAEMRQYTVLDASTTDATANVGTEALCAATIDLNV